MHRVLFASPHGLRWRRWAELALDLLAPRECAACGERTESSTAFCAACGGAHAVPVGSLSDVPLWVAGAYEPPLSLAIGRFKFHGHPELAPRLAALFEEAPANVALSPTDCCVPVPLHVSRLVERGYNQAALLAGAFARTRGLKFLPRLLERRRATDQQARLGREERAGNVRDAFQVRCRPAGRVILVDDVVTTGATLTACIEVLRAGGSEVGAALALARAG